MSKRFSTSFFFMNLRESVFSIRQNSLRNLLTGFGVAWGTFILVMLLGAGNGLQMGIMRIFGNFAQNSLWVYGGMTSNTRAGAIEGRKIAFSLSEIDNLKTIFTEISLISPELDAGSHLVASQGSDGIYGLKGIDLDYFAIKVTKLKEGRFFNYPDKIYRRRCAIVGEKVADELFGKKQKGIGQMIEINNQWFTVVGILKSGLFSGMGTERQIYLPIQTMQAVLTGAGNIGNFGLVLRPGIDAAKFEKMLKSWLSRKLHFDKEDNKALFVFNQQEQIKAFSSLFGAVNAFLWFLGIALLISGMVGIGNIMLVVVKERTKEIGIRKAIGAKNKHIMQMIITESFLITLMSGIMGLFIGFMLIVLINGLFFSHTAEDDIFMGFNFETGIGFLAIFSLVVAGIIAGAFPARKAANIQPIEALNYDAN
ncbi:MAG: ABC transporter permease [Bacteroidales bacterium]|nr:ABC transporter permease [Bacteroidales bacterium]